MKNSSFQFNTNYMNTTTNHSEQPCGYLGNYATWLICISLINNKEAIHVDRYVTPIWYVIGIIGNTITIKIWSKRRKKNSNNSALYLIALACTDIMFLLLHMFIELKYAWGIIQVLDVYIWCPIFFVMFMFSQYASPLTVFAFTMERLVSIALPFKSERFSRYRRTPKQIIISLVFALAMALPQAYGWRMTEGQCIGFADDFFILWTWISDMFIFVFVHCSTFVLNLFVMCISKRKTKQRTNELGNQDSVKLKGKRNVIGSAPSTMTLVCVSFYRIFTTLPVCVVFALQYTIPVGDLHVPVVNMPRDPQWKTFFTWMTIKKVIDEIGMSQYSCNILIYLCTSKMFRHEFIKAFRAVTHSKQGMDLIRHQSAMDTSISTQL